MGFYTLRSRSLRDFPDPGFSGNLAHKDSIFFIFAKVKSKVKLRYFLGLSILLSPNMSMKIVFDVLNFGSVDKILDAVAKFRGHF